MPFAARLVLACLADAAFCAAWERGLRAALPAATPRLLPRGPARAKDD